MTKIKVINNHRQPLTLDSGVILAAAGTPGSERVVASITDRDRRRYVETGRIAVFEVEVEDDATSTVTPSDDSDLDYLLNPSSIATVIARDVVKGARADARKKIDKDKEGRD